MVEFQPLGGILVLDKLNLKYVMQVTLKLILLLLFADVKVSSELCTVYISRC